MSGPKNPKNQKLPVGYRRPPVETQFKPGQSGNPRGRPRKPRTAAGILDAELRRMVTVTAGGKTSKVTALQAMFMRLKQDALAGDAKAAAQVLRWVDYFGASPDDDGAQPTYDLDWVRREIPNLVNETPEQKRTGQLILDFMTIGFALRDAKLLTWEDDGRVWVRRSRLERLFDDEINTKTRERVLDRCHELLID